MDDQHTAAMKVFFGRVSAYYDVRGWDQPGTTEQFAEAVRATWNLAEVTGDDGVAYFVLPSGWSPERWLRQEAEPVDSELAWWEGLAEQAERGMTGESRAFEANWGGMCPCGVRWEPGDLLVWSPDDGQPVHQVCPGDEV